MRILNEKRGLSVVVATVILVAFTLVLIGIIWNVVSNLIDTKTGEASSCFGILDKVSFGREYTCYDSVEKELHFSINIGDIDVEEVIIGISTNTTGKSFSIFEEGSEIDNLKMFDGDETIILPGKESGNTYVFEIGASLEGLPSTLQIIPIVEGTQCEVTDVIREFGKC